ncbi:sensor domain-containing diguanylate cyclase [Corticibacter populi]|uniref:Sensor domain-containing diguanylate cyclase n=1 Tax=Corticibacter populi TaxID=1550736 RepID=A0A3M6QKC8_9BURK|nr:GGDEF domain-containing protein [Corticibacter populi]RMX03477.1 sensor domain-containing diguanylate cyclase [Corticibacter populi]RZS29917.1 diguanylate cyclase (GGDEF)-like protein [Corticibacter populi]
MAGTPLLNNWPRSRRVASRALAPLLFAIVVFLACLIGIHTRPVGFLATVWPANAVMLGLLIRMPSAGRLPKWIAGGIAFMAADLLTGSSLVKALILNGANLAGIAAAYGVYMRSPAAQTGLRQPASMLYLLLAAAAGGAVAGVVGGVANPMLFNGSALRGWVFWCATEFANYAAVLPVILAAPDQLRWRQRLQDSKSLRAADIPPVAVLLLSFMVAAWIGGPGAIAFPVPALLWCALVYPVFPTAALTLLFGVWTLGFISAGYVPAHPDDEMMLVSWRLGISLIAVTPIMLACVMQSRNDLLAKLHHLATHDPLTGMLNRKAFCEDAEKSLAGTRQPCAILMFDLDHFKTVNDTFGHATGDKVLVAFAERVRACLRAQDLFGRLGGEEFAALVFDCTKAQAVALADRIRSATREPVILDDGKSLVITTSIGIAMDDPADGRPVGVDGLLARADTMLYRAKSAGRDRSDV